MLWDQSDCCCVVYTINYLSCCQRNGVLVGDVCAMGSIRLLLCYIHNKLVVLLPEKLCISRRRLCYGINQIVVVLCTQ